MGLFDFLKKKENNQSSKKKITKEEVDTLMLIAMNKMAEGGSEQEARQMILNKGYSQEQADVIIESAGPLYNKYFGDKKGNNAADSAETMTEESVDIHPGIELLAKDSGSHGDHFGGLLGFQYMQTEQGNQFLMEMVSLAPTKAPISQNQGVSVSETDFTATNGDSKLVKLRTIVAQNNIVSAFPILKTNYILPFETKQIYEWQHADNLEAEIKGGGRDTFGLGFFATDYAMNKNRYRTSGKLNINISAFGMVLDKSDFTEIGGSPVSPDFAAYTPNNDLPAPSYYDFIGVLNDFKECKLSNDVSGYIINVKLINQEDEPDFFAVDMFINKENIRITELEKGMRITGALWFQGEIAN